MRNQDKYSEEQLKVSIKKAEDEKAKTEAILDAIGDLISIQDTDFRVIYQNRRHRDLVGDRTGEYCYKAYQGKEHVCTGCHLEMSFKDGEIHTVERSRTSGDKKTYSLNTASLLKDSTGKIIAGIEIVRDITIRKLAEKSLQNAHDKLDQRVKERTGELSKTNEALLSQIQERRKVEEDLLESDRNLKIYARELEESNTALKVLLRQREKDQREFENNILSNMKHLIYPYISKLKKNRKMSDELVYLNMIETNLKEIVSPFSSKLSFQYLDFTPKEILVANLIKDGKQDKDIMEILSISLETVKSHRQNIRKRLGIYGSRSNLRTKLLSFVE
jgi:DNA-binding CsgD family transcriptional regulator/PAS domain-containing protein